MNDADFTPQEHRVAEWLYTRLMMDRAAFYEEHNVDVPAWAGVDLVTVRVSYLREARELIGVVKGNAPHGNTPHAVDDV